MDLIPVCGALLCVLFAAVLVRQVKPEYAVLVTAAGVLAVGAKLLLVWAEQVEALSEIAGKYGLNGFLSLLCKALGAAVASRLTAELCRDCGEGSLASKAELCGKVAILALSLPVLRELLSAL